MYTHREVTPIRSNIFRVTLRGNMRRTQESEYVQADIPAANGRGTCACTAGADGYFRFTLNGREVLREIETAFTLAFGIGERDAVYGLGLHQQTAFNRRGTVCQLLQNNGVSTAVPFMTSSAGYAVLFDTCAFMSVGVDKPCTTEFHDTFDTEEVRPNEIHIFADDADTFTYYVILDESIDGQIAAYRDLTGAAPLFPKWAYGFFQSREHYGTQEEILSVAREFRRRHIPLDCIVQDWNYWGEHGWNAVTWDLNRYPDPAAMTREIHDMDMKIIASVWPSFGPETKICKELEAVGGILEKPDRSGENWGRVHDPFHPQAAAIVWDYMRRNLWENGIDGWWLDSTEPDIGGSNSKNLQFCCDTAKGPTRRFLNAYALASGRNTYRAQRAADENRRVFILTRSGWAGQQRFGISTWTGDITADWGGIPQSAERPAQLQLVGRAVFHHRYRRILGAGKFRGRQPKSRLSRAVYPLVLVRCFQPAVPLARHFHPTGNVVFRGRGRRALRSTARRIPSALRVDAVYLRYRPSRVA